MISEPCTSFEDFYVGFLRPVVVDAQLSERAMEDLRRSRGIISAIEPRITMPFGRLKACDYCGKETTEYVCKNCGARR